MARTESKSFQVHPDEEQFMIGLMEKFHWSLLSSQEIKIKTESSHLEDNFMGDGINSVVTSKTEHYVKLVFQRETDKPNIKQLKALEEKYFAFPSPKYPTFLPGGIVLWGILTLIYGIGIAIWLIYFFAYYSTKKAEADKNQDTRVKGREQILIELEEYS